MSDTATQARDRAEIVKQARELFTWEFFWPIGKRQVVTDSFIEKHADTIAAGTSNLWTQVQAIFQSMFDAVYKWIAPESYAKAETEAAAKAAAAARERALTEQLTGKITDDILRDTGTAVSSAVKDIIADMIAKGRIRHDNVDTLIAATDGATWNQVLPRLGRDVSLRAEVVTTGSYKVQLDLPGGRQENYNVRAAAPTS